MSDLSKILTDKLTSVISASTEKLASELKPMQDGTFDLGPLLREAVNNALDEKRAHSSIRIIDNDLCIFMSVDI